MSKNSTPRSGIDWILAVYPKAYRASHGPEITSIYLENAADLPAGAVAREQADLLGHALRTRLGIGATHLHGRLLALASPYALASLGAFGAVGLFELWMRQADVARFGLPAPVPAFTQQCSLVLSALFVVASALGALGRWSAARVSLVVALVLQAVLVVLEVIEFAHAFPRYGLLRSCYEGPHSSEASILLLILFGVPILAAPGELLDHRRASHRIASVAACVALPSIAVAWFESYPAQPAVQLPLLRSGFNLAYVELFSWSGPAGLLAPLVLGTLLAAAMLRRGADRLEAAAIAGTGCAWLTLWGLGPTRWLIDTTLAAVLLLSVGAFASHRLRALRR